MDFLFIDPCDIFRITVTVGVRAIRPSANQMQSRSVYTSLLILKVLLYYKFVMKKKKLQNQYENLYDISF